MNYLLITEYIEAIKLNATISGPNTTIINHCQWWLSASTIQKSQDILTKGIKHFTL